MSGHNDNPDHQQEKDHEREQAERRRGDNRERDTFTLRILGWFLIAVAALVSLGLLQALQTIDRVLTAAAALALLVVGAGMVWWARRIHASGVAPSTRP